jgi:probable nitrogen fixation protein
MTTRSDLPSATHGSTDPFLHDLADLLRAGDPYGRFDRFADEHLLRPYVVDPVTRAGIAVGCDVEPVILERLRSFYQAVAAGVERASGTMTAVLVDVSHEGFGRAVVFAGRLVLLADPLRDVQRFGFADLTALAAAGQGRIERAVEALETFPEVARADL